MLNIFQVNHQHKRQLITSPSCLPTQTLSRSTATTISILPYRRLSSQPVQQWPAELVGLTLTCGGHLTTMTDKNWGLSKQFRPTLVRQSPASLVAQVLPQPPARLHTIASPTFCTLSSISSSSQLQEPLQRIERYTKHPLLISGVITSALRQSCKINMLRQTLHWY